MAHDDDVTRNLKLNTLYFLFFRECLFSGPRTLIIVGGILWHTNNDMLPQLGQQHIRVFLPSIRDDGLFTNRLSRDFQYLVFNTWHFQKNPS